ncbi:cytoplasmic dynein 1 light intermediate chain 2-like isoform X3 [Ostrea edulis]|uniref:cytoplasmic dynein 1 light intermediate chain 2-like isoform X3 n=1 Tax=Ostrea edulis TaxID=37623 RepID=UPI00209459D3|nr:cytoplasmic dynein 1 light intermediate chain 2-like isoform X3 [Ostrea edulis]
MAPVGEKEDRMGPTVADDDENESQTLWATILGEVQSSSATNLPSTKSVLVLGDNESGKTTLVARLQGVEEPRKGSGLEYYYIDVKDDYRDDQTHAGVWVLDGDPSHTGLLKFAITEENFENILVLLVASMAQPWSIMESLNKWASYLQEHIDRLKLKPEDRREYEESLVRFFQEYTEPDENSSGSQVPSHRRDVNPLHPTASHTEEDKVLRPLGEDTLSQNLGIPIVVVITKSDAISSLEKQHDFKEEHFDFIQQHIRKFCLHYGASLVYSSVKEEKNCDLLYKYLVHRIYGFPFSSPAYVVEKDCVFVPAGWDNDKKISILYENLNTMKSDDCYEDVITKPITRKPIQRDAEVVAEDEQVFLMKQQSFLNKQPAPGPAGETPARPPGSAPPRTTPPRTHTTNNTVTPVTSSPKKMEAGKGTPTSEGMLANFFNSLLNKSTAKTPGATKAGDLTDKAAVSREAAAELERLQKSKKMTPEVKPNGPDSAAS